VKTHNLDPTKGFETKAVEYEEVKNTRKSQEFINKTHTFSHTYCRQGT
jgi:hypothetical protein